MEEEVDKRSRMYKAVKACGRITEFARQDEKSLMRWAAKESWDRKAGRSELQIWSFFLQKQELIWEISVWSWKS